MEMLQDIAAVTAIFGGLVSAMTFGKRRLEKYLHKLVQVAIIAKLEEIKRVQALHDGFGPTG